MKVVAFNGSPHKEGNTYHALRMVLEEAGERWNRDLYHQCRQKKGGWVRGLYHVPQEQGSALPPD